MKNLIKFLTISYLALFCSYVYAENQETNAINYQNLSKRPYQQMPENSKNAKDVYEGASLISDSEAKDKKFHVIRLNMLSKRPYMQKSSD